MIPELKPCPFCPGEVRQHTNIPEYMAHEGAQHGCPLGYFTAPKSAWARRTPAPGETKETGTGPLSDMDGQCGFCCEGEPLEGTASCACSCHRNTSQERAALGVCVSALKKIRLRIADWDEESKKALEEGVRVLSAPGEERKGGDAEAGRRTLGPKESVLALALCEAVAEYIAADGSITNERMAGAAEAMEKALADNELEALNRAEAGDGSPEGSPTARPMKLRADVSFDQWGGTVVIRRPEMRKDLEVVMDVSKEEAEEIAYRINAFEASERGAAATKLLTPEIPSQGAPARECWGLYDANGVIMWAEHPGSAGPGQEWIRMVESPVAPTQGVESGAMPPSNIQCTVCGYFYAADGDCISCKTESYPHLPKMSEGGDADTGTDQPTKEKK